MARGGKRAGAGRPPGAATKVTADLKVAAGEYTETALKVLVSIMKDAQQPAAARVAAANGVLDRGHGKPKQSVEASGPDGAPLSIAVELVRSNVAHEGADT